jgi:FG-GAP-like repeat/NHL repeat
VNVFARGLAALLPQSRATLLSELALLCLARVGKIPQMKMFGLIPFPVVLFLRARRTTALLGLVAFLLLAIVARGQPFYTFSTFAGSGGDSSSLDGTGTAASFNGPSGIAVDGAGNIYVTTQDATVRKITPAGIVTTFSGQAGNINNGGSTTAFSSSLFGAAVDSSGNVYVADAPFNLIRVITPADLVFIFAGKTYGYNDGPGSVAQFKFPWSVAVDSADNVYVADLGNQRIRKITPGSFVTTLAGSGASGSADGTGTAASFASPNQVAVDAAGNVYVGDSNNYTIRKVSPAGVVTTLAGQTGVAGSADGSGSAAQFKSFGGLAADASGNVYVSDGGNYAVRKITAAGVVTTLAGNPLGWGSSDGTGTDARFFNPLGVALDAAGNLYVADNSNHLVRKVTSAGVVTTIAGGAGVPGNLDGDIGSARFNFPRGMVFDGTDNLYVADSGNNVIRKITSAGVVTTLAGSGASGGADGTGTAASFDFPQNLALDGSGNIYVADSRNQKIRKITSDGVVTTLAGSGSAGSADGTGTAAGFNSPSGLVVDAAGNLFVADSSNHTIRKITPDGVVTTIAGLANAQGSADGTGTAARFSTLQGGMTMDNAGNLYVADTDNYTIRQITAAGVVSTYAGVTGVSGSADGPRSSAKLGYLTGSCLSGDDSGNIFVADSGNGTIRQIAPGGMVTTIGGSTGHRTFRNGVGSYASFITPGGIAISKSHKIYIADSQYNTIRVGTVGIRASDFDWDGKADLIWENFITGEHGLWLMNGSTVASWVGLPTVPADWHVVGDGDFNNDGQTDIVWENTATGEHGIWLMSGSLVFNWAGLPTEPTDWHVATTGDFNHDRQTDIVWENTATGEHGIWLMNGSAVSTWAGLPTEPTAWRIVGTGDFNGDGQTDIVWENTATGEHGIWLMDGSTVFNWAGLPMVPADWHVVGMGDFNGDGQVDIVWENTVTGERGIWVMNNSAVINWVTLPTEPVTWHIAQ